MDLTQVTSATTTYVADSTTSETVISSDFETFLKMLTVQMENQDPLDPTDSAEYAMQLATFSGVEQQVLTNDLLTSLMTQMNATGMAQIADWVGKEARAAMPAHFSGSPITISPNPVATADTVELVVYDSDGNEVERSEIPVSADPIEWSGTSADGTPYEDGLYEFRVVSSSNGEVLLDDLADVYASVQEVRSEAGEIILMMEGDVAVLSSTVSAIREETS
ncbi:flagellar hook assembly protein FlgD [Octadecabacter sp.]|nr:flagellar hook assembly protein FlgD [Octadecabacter sp.]